MLLEGGVGVEEIFFVLAEDGAVRSRCGGESAHFSVFLADADAGAQWAFVVCGIEASSGGGVVVIEGSDVEVTLCQLSFQFSAEVIEIDVFESASVGDEGEAVAEEAERAVGCFRNIFLIFFSHRQRAFRAARVRHVDVHSVLSAVERDDGEACRVGGEVDAGHVGVRVEGQFECACDAVFDVEGHDADAAVHLSRHGIFVAIGAGIVVAVFVDGLVAFIHRHGVERHAAFVVAHPRQHFAVGGEVKGACGGELLLVHPVGQTVDEFVEFAVFGDAALSVAVEEFHDKEVALSYKRHHRAVGREDGLLLRSAIGERLVGVVLCVIYIIYGREGTAVDGFALRHEQNLSAVGGERESLDLFQSRLAARFVGIKEHARLTAVAEGEEFDAFQVGGEAGIVVALGGGVHTVGLRNVVPVTDVLQRQRGGLCLCRLSGGKPAAQSGQRHGGTEERGSFHDEIKVD